MASILPIGQNIKKLREEEGVTQQQLADALGVTFQAVSKWECGATAPDVAMLPEIAEFFGVSVDDLFRPPAAAYRNRFERLLSRYETDIRQTEVFDQANREFSRLISENAASAADLRGFAYLNELRARHHLQLAEKYYRMALEEGEKSKDAAYYKTERQYIHFLSGLGRHRENIERHSALLEREPDNPMRYCSLTAAYLYAGDPENAADTAERGLVRFPECALLLCYAGDAYKRMGRGECAADCWNRAWQLDPELIDARYSLAFDLAERGETEKAGEVFREIMEWNRQRGFYLENRWIHAELRKLERKRGQD